MHILNDFFLIVWQEDARVIFSSSHDIDSFLNTALKTDYETFCDYSSIILITTPQNIDNFAQVQEAQNALKYLSGVQAWDKQRVQYLQKELLFFLNKKGDTTLNKSIEKRFDTLRKEGIIGYENARKLISLLALIEEKEEEKIVAVEEIYEEQSDSFYKNSIAKINLHVRNILELVESESLQARVKNIPQKINEQSFSIGITGVMNAGKSTMLNALLGKDILGTSVVPETANLTILKYSKTPSAKVNFWDKAEWAEIEKSASSISSIQEFIKETKEHFKENLEQYITQEGFSKEIKTEELAFYTSAKHSDKVCNLVKSVTLYSDLEFLKDGVQIVDTPGLDDPVVQREEITKSYLGNCDLMIHLMNVNQSATEKDVEFIVDTLLYQNVSRLLIIITRIDSVKENELKEVIAYTKTSIKNKLKEINKENRFDSIIDKLDFIPVASLMALYHRVGRGQEALDAGYSLEKSGILHVERYLQEVLFGKTSEKVKIILQSAIKEMDLAIDSSKTLFNQELELYGKNSQDIAQEIEKFDDEIKEIKKQIEKLALSVEDATSELNEYFATLKNLAKNRVLQLQAIIKRRVIDDVSYEIRKNKKRPNEQRISYIIDSGIKDGFIDLVREYRYAFQKRVNELFERLKRSFDAFEKQDSFSGDSKEFFNRHFSDYAYAASNTTLVNTINAFIDSYAKKNLEILDVKIDEIFEEFFQNIYTKFDKQILHVNQNLLSEFTKEVSTPIELIQNQMHEKQSILQNTKAKLEDNSFDVDKRVSTLEEKLNKMAKTQEKLASLRSSYE